MIKNADSASTFGKAEINTQVSISMISDMATEKCSGLTGLTIGECGKKEYSTEKAKSIKMGKPSLEFLKITVWLKC